MKTLAELKAERAAKLMAADSLFNKADKEKRPMTDTEQELFSSLMSDKKELEAKIKVEEDKLATIQTRADLKADIEALKEVSAPAAINPDGDISGDITKPITQSIEERWKLDPMKGFKSHKEYLTSVMKLNGRDARSSTDKRLHFLSADRLMDEFMAAVGSDEQGNFDQAVGGVFMPEQMTPEVLKVEPEPDFTGMRTRKIPMGTPIVKINARVDKDHTTSVSGGFTVSRTQETNTGTASRAKYEQIRLEADNLFGTAFATEQLLTDSPQSFIQIISDGFADEFTSHLTGERFNGNGAGEYQGILNANNKSLITVAKDSGQTASTITLKNVLNIMARSWRFGSGNSLWVASQDIIPALGQLNIDIGTGGAPVFMFDARDRFPAMLFGQPMVFSEHIPTLGAAGQLGYYNFNEYLEGIYQPLQSAESVHVRFLNHERAFKFWTRNAAAPWWTRTLQPKTSGTNTLSPFVTLGAI